MKRDAAADTPDTWEDIDIRLDAQFTRATKRLDQIFWLLIAIFAASLMLMFTIVWALG